MPLATFCGALLDALFAPGLTQLLHTPSRSSRSVQLGSEVPSEVPVEMFRSDGGIASDPCGELGGAAEMTIGTVHASG